jgi:superfamily I DNA and/or RNA helicase
MLITVGKFCQKVSTDLNRFNVALSRARTRVVILASPHALSCLPSSFAGFKARNTFRSILAFDCERVDPK